MLISTFLCQRKSYCSTAQFCVSTAQFYLSTAHFCVSAQHIFVAMSFACEFCQSEFKTQRSLTVHKNNPPRYCEKLRVKEYNPINNEVVFVKGKTDREKDNEAIYLATHGKLGSAEYHQASLLDRYMKMSNKHLDRVEGANIFNFHQEQNLDEHNLFDLHRACRNKRKAIDTQFDIDKEHVNTRITQYQSKYGVRAEENQFLNAVNDAQFEELTKVRELLMLKVGVIDTLMMKKDREYVCLNNLEGLLGRDIACRFEEKYGKPMSMSLC